MRVLVDGDPLDRSAYRGMGTYARQVIAGLAAEAGFEVSVLSRRGTDLPAGARRRRVLRVAPDRWAEAEHDLIVPVDAARCRADVFFSPGNHPPRWSRHPVVQTLHDAYPLSNPEALDQWRRAWERRRHRWPRLDAVVAVSEYSARCGVELLGLDPARVTVARSGVDPVFRPPAGGERGGSPGPPYLLMVGEYDPRKRHHLAFEVAGRIARSHPHRLKVAGAVARWNEAQITALVRAAPRPERIELLGFVSRAELVRLYQGAAAVLVTSSCEGFGLPALEAMACGAPVVAFDNSATSEVVAGAGILVPDGDVDAMVGALERLLGDAAEEARLRAAGPARAAEFTWESSVAVHAGVLRAVAAGG